MLQLDAAEVGEHGAIRRSPLPPHGKKSKIQGKRRVKDSTHEFWSEWCGVPLRGWHRTRSPHAVRHQPVICQIKVINGNFVISGIGWGIKWSVATTLCHLFPRAVVVRQVDVHDSPMASIVHHTTRPQARISRPHAANQSSLYTGLNGTTLSIGFPVL